MSTDESPEQFYNRMASKRDARASEPTPAERQAQQLELMKRISAEVASYLTFDLKRRG